jgi:hypothetical protein
MFLGGAALQRCGKCIIMTAALAAEVMVLAPERLFPQPVQPLRDMPSELRGVCETSSNTVTA